METDFAFIPHSTFTLWSPGSGSVRVFLARYARIQAEVYAWEFRMLDSYRA